MTHGFWHAGERVVGRPPSSPIAKIQPCRWGRVQVKMANINTALTSLALVGLLAPTEAFITTSSSRHLGHRAHHRRTAARAPTFAANDGGGDASIPDSVHAVHPAVRHTVHHRLPRSSLTTPPPATVLTDDTASTATYLNHTATL